MDRRLTSPDCQFPEFVGKAWQSDKMAAGQADAGGARGSSAWLSVRSLKVAAQNGTPTPNQNCTPELTLMVLATSKRSRVRSTKLNHDTSKRKLTPTS
jgi:hypothetical protein